MSLPKAGNAEAWMPRESMWEVEKELQQGRLGGSNQSKKLLFSNEGQYCDTFVLYNKMRREQIPLNVHVLCIWALPI